MDNWVDIAEFIRTKTKQECEDHYYSFYNKSKADNLPTATDLILERRDGAPLLNEKQAALSSAKVAQYREKREKEIDAELKEFMERASEEPRESAKKNKKEGGVSNVNEVLGFMPKRGDFE